MGRGTPKTKRGLTMTYIAIIAAFFIGLYCGLKINVDDIKIGYED